ncbi:MAG: hypothetical protein JNK50_04355 [Bacteroidia bacterium]|nr:hypothetical protein [Bacteroidia bacterium]
MTQQTEKSKAILSKKETLEKAAIQMKKEFVGIDSIIDNVISSISSWYLFPEIQTKPVIINLWGLTGVGKSSMIKRLAELIDFNNKYYRFDLGSKRDKFWEVKGMLEDIYQRENGYPIILGFDEFQHAKTIDEDQKEIISTEHRIIWDVLDSGKFSISKNFTVIDRIHALREKLKYVLLTGVKVENGLVTKARERFIDLLDIRWRWHRDKDNMKVYDFDDLLFVDPDQYSYIFELTETLFKSEYEVRDYMVKLSGDETIDFLSEVITIGLTPKTVDCSKALIFVMGNIDEAFWMSNDFNPDVNADEFHEQSLKINIPDIKRALRRRFRNEQIARLGNIHFIYPSFSEKSFFSLIEIELNKLSKEYKTNFGIDVTFSDEVKKLIYKEGVFPTQGTRPLFTTINYLICSKIGIVYYETQVNVPETECVEFSAVDGHLLINFKKDSKTIQIIKEKVELSLDKLRKNRKDDLQAITAVHEAGHAVLAIALLNTLPEYAYSVTADSESQGFVYTKRKLRYTSKKDIKNRIAVQLGGLVAEKIIFGEENITTGAESDIFNATSFAAEMIKSSGMGSVLGAVSVKSVNTNNYLHDDSLNLNTEILGIINEAKALAEKTLNEEIMLLTKISEHLANNPIIKKEQLKALMLEFGSKIDRNKVLNEKNDEFYRSLLKKRKDSLVKGDSGQIELLLPGYTLNQDKTTTGFSEPSN